MSFNQVWREKQSNPAHVGVSCKKCQDKNFSEKIEFEQGFWQRKTFTCPMCMKRNILIQQIMDQRSNAYETYFKDPSTTPKPQPNAFAVQGRIQKRAIPAGLSNRAAYNPLKEHYSHFVNGNVLDAAVNGLRYGQRNGGYGQRNGAYQNRIRYGGYNNGPTGNSAATKTPLSTRGPASVDGSVGLRSPVSSKSGSSPRRAQSDSELFWPGVTTDNEGYTITRNPNAFTPNKPMELDPKLCFAPGPKKRSARREGDDDFEPIKHTRFESSDDEN